jgi:hypothetical protein
MNRILLSSVVAAVAVSGCGGGSSSGGTKAANPNAPEVSPAGDIPDNQAYVAYSPPGASYSVKVPEGWSRSTTGAAVTFTDKLNAIRMETHAAGAAPTVAKVKRGAPKGATVTVVKRKAGSAVLERYLTSSKPNAVTGKATRDAVERYSFFHKGKELVLTLSGPKGADNVDPWKLVTDSVSWR